MCKNKFKKWFTLLLVFLNSQNDHKEKFESIRFHREMEKRSIKKSEILENDGKFGSREGRGNGEKNLRDN